MAAKSKDLSPSRLLMDSYRDILAMKFVDPALDDIPGLEDHELHVILTQTFNEDERALESASNTMRGKFILPYAVMQFENVMHFSCL